MSEGGPDPARDGCVTPGDDGLGPAGEGCGGMGSGVQGPLVGWRDQIGGGSSVPNGDPGSTNGATIARVLLL